MRERENRRAFAGYYMALAAAKLGETYESGIGFEGSGGLANALRRRRTEVAAASCDASPRERRKREILPRLLLLLLFFFSLSSKGRTSERDKTAG